MLWKSYYFVVFFVLFLKSIKPVPQEVLNDVVKNKKIQRQKLMENIRFF